MRVYRVLVNGKIVESKRPGKYASWTRGKIFLGDWIVSLECE